MYVDDLRQVIDAVEGPHAPGCEVVVRIFGHDWRVGQVAYSRPRFLAPRLRLELDSQAGRIWRTVRRSWWWASHKAEPPAQNVYAAWARGTPWPPFRLMADEFSLSGSIKIDLEYSEARRRKDKRLGTVLFYIVFVLYNIFIISIVVWVLGVVLGFWYW